MSFQQSLAVLRNDRRNLAITEIAITFAFMAGAVCALVLRPGPLTYGIAFLVFGLMQYRIVISCHEAVHKKLLFPLWLNESVGSVLCALVGINLLGYRSQHLGHHAAQDIEHDTDAYIYEPILREKPGVRRIAVWIFGTATEFAEKLRQKGFSVTATVEARGNVQFYSLAIVAVQFLLLLICTVWLSWWYYFAFWLLPLMTIAIFMNRTRVLVEHGYAHVPVLAGSPLAGRPVQAIDLSAGFLERFLIAPFAFNYHGSHHRVPLVPYYKGRELSRLLEQSGEVLPAFHSPTYFQALRHVLWN